MNQKTFPHETMNQKNNGLSSAQEVHYSSDFKKADKASQQVEKSRG